MRNLVLKLFQWFGVFGIWRSMKRNEIIVLCLHGVMDEGVKTKWTPLRPQYPRATLDTAIRTLKQHYNFVSLDEAVEMLQGKRPIERNSIVLTFDDGYLNNLVHALPILREHNVPCVMYIAVGNTEERSPFWFDRLDYAIQHADVHEKSFTINGEQVTIDASTRSNLKRTFKQLRNLAKKGHRSDLEMLAELQQLSEDLENQKNVRLSDIFEEDDWSSVMDWKQVVEAAEDPLVTIGSHTVDHIRLGEVDESRAMRELKESKKTLESHGVPECKHFCYPDGNYNQETTNYVANAGYQTAVTTEPGMNPVNTNLMKIKRIHLPESNDPGSILYVASGMADAISSIRGS
jgi:peptidoglycan/xylan/chitin deacetylase (PgdA/CDA1 family)